MENTITKEILKNKLYTGNRPAIELLYTEYSDMVYGYILQFTPDREEAETLLARIFTYLSGRLEEACESSLGVYCWLQMEARKIILHYKEHYNELPFSERPDPNRSGSSEDGDYYFSLLREASYEQKWVFRELFLIGREKDELARLLQKDIPYIDNLLRESLVMIRKNLE